MPNAGKRPALFILVLLIAIAGFATFTLTVKLPEVKLLGIPKPLVIKELKVEELYAEFVKDQTIVKFKDRIKNPAGQYLDTRVLSADDLATSNYKDFFNPLIGNFKLLKVSRIHKGINVDTSLHLDRVYLLNFAENIDLDKFIEYCDGFKNIVEYCQKDAIGQPYALPNDPRVGDMWAVDSLNLEAAWDITTGSSNVKIADIDDGFDADHPDLAANFLNLSSSVSGASHGTNVVGTFGAVGNNGQGIAGANWEVGILGYAGLTSTSGVASATREAADAGAKVINMSFGFHTTERGAAYEAAKYADGKGVVIIVAAGNCLNREPTEQNCRFQESPQDWEMTIPVAAISRGDQRASFSSYYPGVWVTAPGDKVLSTQAGGSYAEVSGTSFSSPYTAGVVGLMFAVNSSITPGEVRTILKETAVDLGDPGKDDYYGYGKVDAGAAVDRARQGPEPPPPEEPPPGDITPPTVSLVYPEEREAPYSGNIQLQATANDNVGMDRVEFYVNNGFIDTDTTSPYQLTWNSNSVANGQHTFFAKAVDTSGNEAESASVTATINNVGGGEPEPPPPQPPAGDTLEVVKTATPDAVRNEDLPIDIKFEITVTAKEEVDNVTITNETLVTKSDGTRFTVDQDKDGNDITGWPRTGESQIDLEANETWTTTYYITATAPSFENSKIVDTVSAVGQTPTPPGEPPPGDTQAPTVSIENPRDGDTVSGMVMISAVANDNVGVVSVEFFVDGGSRGVSTTTPYSYQWDTGRESAGTHTIRAEAKDAAGNIGRSSTVTVTVQEESQPPPPEPPVPPEPPQPPPGGSMCCGIGGCIYPPGRRSVGRDQCYYVCGEDGLWRKENSSCVSQPTMCCGAGGCNYRPGTPSRGGDGCLYVCQDTGLWKRVSCL